LFICLCLLMSLTIASHSFMGASNRTYVIFKALIGFCCHSVIAHSRTVFHCSLLLYTLSLDYLKGNSFLSLDKKLFLFRHYSFPLWNETFSFRQERIISWKETFLPTNKEICSTIKAILLYRKHIILFPKCVLLSLKCFLLHAKAFLIRINSFLLAWKTFSLSIKCLSLKPYIPCLRQTVFGSSDKHFGQAIFYVGSSRKHFGASRIQLLSSQTASFTGKKVFCLGNIQSFQEIKHLVTLNINPYGEGTDSLFTLHFSELIKLYLII